MKFLIDAQLPVRLSRFLQTTGYDTIHTRDLRQQNTTPDLKAIYLYWLNCLVSTHSLK